MTQLATTSSDVVKYPDLLHESGSIGCFEKIIIGNIIYMTRPELIVETGLYKGYTHQFMTEFIRLNNLPECRVVSFDFPEVIAEVRARNDFFKTSPGCELLGGQLPEALAQFLTNCRAPIDFAVIDADHSYKGVLQDLRLIVPRLRPGGYVFCHDYRPHDPQYRGLAAAVDDYSFLNGLSVFPIGSGGKLEAEDIWGSVLIWKPLEKKSPFSRLVDATINRFRYGK